MLMDEEIRLYSRMPISSWLATFGDSAVKEPMWDLKPPDGESRLVFHCHVHDEFEIHQVRRGELHVEINANRYTLYPGDILIVNPYERHSGTISQDIITEYLHATFDVNYFTRSCAEANVLFRNLFSGEIHYPNVITSDNPVSYQIGKALENINAKYQAAMYANENRVSVDFHLAIAVQELMMLLIDTVTPIKNETGQDRNARFTRNVQQYVSNHFRCSLTTEQIANDLGYTTNYFCSMFKTNFGIPFKQYLNERRIEYAITWLQNTPLTEMASTLGYTDYNYFCRVFKKQTGLTPSEMFGRAK